MSDREKKMLIIAREVFYDDTLHSMDDEPYWAYDTVEDIFEYIDELDWGDSCPMTAKKRNKFLKMVGEDTDCTCLEGFCNIGDCADCWKFVVDKFRDNLDKYGVLYFENIDVVKF